MSRRELVAAADAALLKHQNKPKANRFLCLDQAEGFQRHFWSIPPLFSARRTLGRTSQLFFHPLAQVAAAFAAPLAAESGNRWRQCISQTHPGRCCTQLPHPDFFFSPENSLRLEGNYHKVQPTHPKMEETFTPFFFCSMFWFGPQSPPKIVRGGHLGNKTRRFMSGSWS
jgi:hypothetical protein